MMDEVAVGRALRNKADRKALLRLQKEVKELADALQLVVTGLQAVADKEQRFVTTVTNLVANVPQDITVTWPQAWPDTVYGVYPAPPTVGAAALGKVFASLKPGTKTTTDCVVSVVATQAVATCVLDVLGVRTSVAT